MRVCGDDEVGDPDATETQKKPSQQWFEEEEEDGEYRARCNDESDDDAQYS